MHLCQANQAYGTVHMVKGPVQVRQVLQRMKQQRSRETVCQLSNAAH